MVLNVYLVIMLKYQNTKTFLLIDILQIGLKNFSRLKQEVKNTVPWTYVISDFNDEEVIETFHEKELQKMNQEKFRIEKVINYMLNGNIMITH